VLIFSPAF